MQIGGSQQITQTRLLWCAVSSVGFAAPACSSTSAPSSQDISQVFCLSTDQQHHLVDAAVALGLAERGTTQPLRVVNQDLTIGKWQASHGADFDRACRAVVGAAQLPQAAQNPRTEASASAWAVLLPVLAGLLPVFAGALITGLTTLWRDGTARDRRLAEALGAANDEFVRSSQTYVEQWTNPKRGGRPTDQDLRESRDRLTARLGEVAAARPKWSVPRQLLEGLLDGPLGEQLARTFVGLDDENRDAKARSVRQELSELHTTIAGVVRALEQPGRPHRAMRQSKPTSNRRQTAA